jgi:hypothetical protein
MFGWLIIFRRLQHGVSEVMVVALLKTGLQMRQNTIIIPTFGSATTQQTRRKFITE